MPFALPSTRIRGAECCCLPGRDFSKLLVFMCYDIDGLQAVDVKEMKYPTLFL